MFIVLCPTRNGSTALQRFGRGNAIEIRNGTMFDFYPGLPYRYCTTSYIEVEENLNERAHQHQQVANDDHKKPEIEQR